jgi:membrane fusion protein (multidrug efflux system)
MIFVPSPVKSPIAGTVSNIPVYVGSTITQGIPIARVTTTDNLEIRTEVAERFIGKMRIGLEALVSFEAFPGETFRGSVTELSPLVDPASRSLEIKVRLNRLDPRIRPGMFAALKIITERKWGIVKIPVDCLVRRYGGTFVFVVKDDPAASTGKRVERRPVTPWSANRRETGNRKRFAARRGDRDHGAVPPGRQLCGSDRRRGSSPAGNRYHPIGGRV